ncbi:patatin-like phospholipase family protein [Muricoccus pecuniae]|uniref:NTE family protein n=1 Tax=Muricoccus pecuniae TaxID=693023 RepID=A0A840YI38_9PROT|nr:patatin-like phospholipase family protein [Roseomonas pecuniae]MBB5696121.1 NTE family protein [Roseomonas pecuniae]
MPLSSGVISRRNDDAQAPEQGQPITLALQGGGSLGAFAWGVLERLLDVPSLRIEVVSGASAGAMNAALLVQGLATGGPAEAKRLLETFWRRVAVASGSPDIAATAGWLFPFAGIMEPMADILRQTTKGMAQSQLNPLGLNPLRSVLEDLFDPSVLGRDGVPSLVVSATRVSTGEARLFRDAEVTLDVLLASSCLPQLFPAVEIDGDFYWDGGFASNPPLRALIEAGAPADIVLVRTTPVERPGLPTSAAAVLERTEEMTFGAALRQELRSLALAQRVLADLPSASGVLARLRDARLHVIGAEEEFRALKTGSHQDPSWAFLQQMRELGQQASVRWLATDLAGVGVRSTIDLADFAGPTLDLPLRPQSIDSSAHASLAQTRSSRRNVSAV